MTMKMNSTGRLCLPGLREELMKIFEEFIDKLPPALAQQAKKTLLPREPITSLKESRATCRLRPSCAESKEGESCQVPPRNKAVCFRVKP